jgi:hypothetical protein
VGLFSIPTAPTITPDDSVALTLLGRVKRGRKSGILFPSCSQLNLISTRLRLGRMARRMLKNEFPTQFLSYLGEDGAINVS